MPNDRRRCRPIPTSVQPATAQSRMSLPTPFPKAADAWRAPMLAALVEAQAAVLANNQPFGAVLVVDGNITLRSQSTVLTDGDPTCHAAFKLVRLASKNAAAAALVTEYSPRILPTTPRSRSAKPLAPAQLLGFTTATIGIPGRADHECNCCCCC